MKTNTVFVVYLQFGGVHFESALKIFKEKILSKIHYSQLKWITLDNAELKDIEIIVDAQFQYVAGDNSSREFSAYDRGVQIVNSMNPRLDDLVIFLNDTFHRSYGDTYLDLLNPEMFRNTIRQNAICGYVDQFPRSVQGFGREIPYWIRTSFFCLPYCILKKVIPFVPKVEKNQVFGETIDAFFQTNSLLSENYKDYLKTWLYESPKPNAEFKEEWHSKKSLTSETIKELQEKCWCILCEQQLTARALEQKIPIIKINK